MADATEGRKPATEDPTKLSSGHKLPQNVTRNWDTVRRKLKRATGTREKKKKNETLRATRSTKSRSRNSNSDDECQDFAHHRANLLRILTLLVGEVSKYASQEESTKAPKRAHHSHEPRLPPCAATAQLNEI